MFSPPIASKAIRSRWSTDGDGLSNNTMQAIAREMNLSETVFVPKAHR